MQPETFLVLDKVFPDRRINEEKYETGEFTVNVEDIICYEPFDKFGAETMLTVKERGSVHIVQTSDVIQQMLIEVGCMLCIRT